MCNRSGEKEGKKRKRLGEKKTLMGFRDDNVEMERTINKRQVKVRQENQTQSIL